MPITVPIRSARRSANAQPLPSPPDPSYTLMAAAQMHSEGRLLATDQSGSDAKLNSIPQSETSPVRS